MTNRSKQKGTAWETQVVNYLKDNGWPYAERRTLSGNSDRGDINFDPTWILECKDEAKITLSEYMREVEVEKQNAGALFGAAIVKARRKSVDQAYVVLSLVDFVRILQHLD